MDSVILLDQGLALGGDQALRALHHLSQPYANQLIIPQELLISGDFDEISTFFTGYELHYRR